MVIELKELKVLRNDRKWGQNLQTDVKKKMRLRAFCYSGLRAKIIESIKKL